MIQGALFAGSGLAFLTVRRRSPHFRTRARIFDLVSFCGLNELKNRLDVPAVAACLLPDVHTAAQSTSALKKLLVLIDGYPEYGEAGARSEFDLNFYGPSRWRF